MESQGSPAIVLFDGTCAFCRGSVAFIAARDPRGHFRFGASQSEQGRHLLEPLGIDPTSTRSIVLIDGGNVYLKSTAVLHISRKMTPPWNWLGVLLWVPRPLRDAVYDAVAAVRHRIAGTTDVCAIPPSALRSRLL